MSLVSTLAKVAIGIAVAKGVSHLAKNGMGGGGAGGSAGRGTPMGDTFSPKTGGAGGGLSDMMGDILGGGSGNGRTASTQSGGGGLGGMFDQLPDAAVKKSTGKNTRANAPTSIEDLLGGGSGRSAGGGGSLGDLLGGMLGGATAGGRTTAGAAPQGGGGLGDLLGAVLGGAAVGGASGGGLGDMLNKALTGKGKTLEEPNHAQELAAGLMLKVMIQAVKSDAKLDEDEKKKLMDSLGDATQAEMKFVNAELAAPVDIDGLARQIPQGMEAQAYMMSLMAINLDNQNEAQYLHAFAQALELEKDQVNAIHDHVQAPRLYT
jgi:uncharacterized membrane protein YebE (DUF533 family)